MTTYITLQELREKKTPTHITLQELRKMAAGKKIKHLLKLSKIELVKALNLDERLLCKPSSAREVLITNVDTQVVTKYKSICQCSKALDKNSGLVYYYLKCGNEFVDKDGNKVRLSFV